MKSACAREQEGKEALRAIQLIGSQLRCSQARLRASPRRAGQGAAATHAGGAQLGAVALRQLAGVLRER